MDKQNIIVFRITQSDFEALKRWREKAGRNETQAFVLCSKAEGFDETIYLVNKIIFPDSTRQ